MSAVDTGFVCEYCDREFPTEKGAMLHERDWCPDNPQSRKSRGDPPAGRRKATPAEATTAFDDTPSETPPAEPGIFDEPVPEKQKTPWREKIWGAGPKPPAARRPCFQRTAAAESRSDRKNAPPSDPGRVGRF